MPRQKRDATYTRRLKNLITKNAMTSEDAARIIGVRVDTLNGWLYTESRAEAPKWAYDLLAMHLDLQSDD